MASRSVVTAIKKQTIMVKENQIEQMDEEKYLETLLNQFVDEDEGEMEEIADEDDEEEEDDGLGADGEPY